MEETIQNGRIHSRNRQYHQEGLGKWVLQYILQYNKKFPVVNFGILDKNKACANFKTNEKGKKRRCCIRWEKWSKVGIHVWIMNNWSFDHFSGVLSVGLPKCSSLLVFLGIKAKSRPIARIFIEQMEKFMVSKCNQIILWKLCQSIRMQQWVILQILLRVFGIFSR
jgi:hypothetical protein